MATLRSSSFYKGQPAAPSTGNQWTTAYTVPTGHVIVVKGVTASNQGSTSKIAQVRINGLVVVFQQSLPSGATVSAAPWVVLPFMEYLEVLQQAGGAVQYTISGLLLYT